MEIKDLKEGEIYSCIHHSVSDVDRCIFKATDNNHIVSRLTYGQSKFWNSSNFNQSLSKIQKATEEEKHWLNKCIKANKFIPLEEALKSFKQEVLVQTNLIQEDACNSCKYITNCSKGPHNIDGKTKCSAYGGQHYPKEINTMKENVEEVPEYVELYKSGWDDKLLNTIWKTSNRFPSENVNWTTSWTWKYLLTDENHKQYFRASTASAYNAQFKKEEPMDLLAEARKKFSPGVTFKSPQSGTIYTIPISCNFYKESEGIRYDSEGKQPWIYYNGKWAEIVSEAKQPEEKKYAIGGWVRLTKDFDYRGNSYKKGEYHQITNVSSSNKPSVVCFNRTNGFGNANTLKVELYTEFSTQIPECEWVGMNKPNSFGEQINVKNIHQWADYSQNLISEQILNLHNEPITIKKSKVQQVEVVPLQKPCIISTRKSKLNLIKL